MSKKGVVVAKSSGLVVGGGAKHRRALHVGPHARVGLLGIAVLVIIGGALWAVLAYHNDHSGGKKPKKSTQAQLQDNINNSYTIGNADALKEDANALIDGAASGKYKVSNQQLSFAYLSRANAELNKGNYKAAVPDYDQAIKLDDANKLVALQGEVEARYKMGQRQELIPLYQQMIDLESKSENPRHGSATMQYQANIQALQKGQEISF
jgi:tetratricopeptide (TPR) repeat protein